MEGTETQGEIHKIAGADWEETCRLFSVDQNPHNDEPVYEDSPENIETSEGSDKLEYTNWIDTMIGERADPNNIGENGHKIFEYYKNKLYNI